MRQSSFLLAGLWLAVSCASHPQDPWRPAFDSCKEAAAQHDPTGAEMRCNEALSLARGEELPPGLRVAVSANALGVLYLDQGRLGEARPLLLESLSLFKARNAASPNEHFVALLTNVGDLDMRSGNPSAAEPTLRRALALASQLDPPREELVSRSNRLLMASLCNQHKLDEAAAIGEPLRLECKP